MKGGYKIIDFKNVSLSGTPVTMTDVLVDLLNNYEKVVLLSHVVLSGSAKDDCFSTVLSDGDGGVKLNCYDGYISINSSGAVTYTVASASGMAENIAELTAEIGDLDDLETTDKDSVVDAINEVRSIFTTQFIDVKVNFDGSPISANAVYAVTKPLSIPSGYTPLCISGFSVARTSGITVTQIGFTSDNVSIGGYNGSSTTELNGNVTMVCVKLLS